MFSPISATSRRLFQQDVTVTLAMFDSAVGLLYLLCFYNSCELLGGSFKSFTKSVKTVQITVTLISQLMLFNTGIHVMMKSAEGGSSLKQVRKEVK